MYLTPYFNQLGLQASIVSFLYLLYGISGIAGSGLGSIFTEKLGVKKTLTMLMTVYFFVLLAFIVTQYNVWTLSINVMLFGLTGWSMNAPTTDTNALNSNCRYKCRIQSNI